ncbi:MAG: hypothetical protein ACE14S_08865 [Candidatus Bathyarchaeia archaeon]
MSNDTERKALYVGIAGLIVGSVLSGLALIQTWQVALLNADLTKQQTALTEQANNLTATALQISNFNTTIVPYIVEADLGRVYSNVSNPTYAIHSEGFINISLVVITPHAAILNFSKGDAFQCDFWKRSDTFPSSDGIPIPIIDYVMMWRYSLNNTWELDFNPLPARTYVAFIQPGVTQLNFSFPIGGSYSINREYVDSLGDKFVQLLNICDFNVEMNFTDLQTNCATQYEYSGIVNAWFTSGYPH